MAAFDLCVLPGGADLSQAQQKPPGQLRLARVNPTLVESNGTAAKAAQIGLPVISSASGAGPARYDLSVEKWLDFTLQEVAEQVLAKGFDGWVVEGSDPRMREWVRTLRQRHPKRTIVVRDASLFAEEAQHLELGLYLEAPAKDLKAHEATIQKWSEMGAAVLVVTYEADSPSELAARLTTLKALPFETTRDLNGVSLAPLKERTRRILVLYGWDPKRAEKAAMLPIDTMTGELFQTPLEWLGFECDYLNVAQEELPREVSARFAAVLVDAEIQIPGERELAVVEWLATAKAAQIPILFAGSLPFSTDDALSRCKDVFGLEGTLVAMPQASGPKITFRDSQYMASEAKVVPRLNEFHDLRAPADAKVLLSLTAQSDQDTIRYDPVFIASWGGMWLEPYVILRASQDSYLFYADPYKLFEAFLAKAGNRPVPDVTTRDGCRLFYSHIDGDGFASLTDFRGHPFCGEVVRDRILKKYPIPVTVSVVEADITAEAEGVEDDAQAKLANIARSIFAVPNVQVASHSFSHPYQWDPEDPNPGIYTEANMPLKPSVKYPKIDVTREIRGSIEYIKRELAPANKDVELMLWSGNCRPGIAALRMVREMGMENMNGGNTIVSRLYPGIAGIAPRVMAWGDELQINAANQNEFMYANGWTGPFNGGYADVIDTFERTESPRRVKPVNVYYHFYSATCLSSLKALEKVHQWSLDQPLHPVTAREYALIVKDASRTHLYELGANHWLLANAGFSRTFRFPASLGKPDMERCHGVTGWLEHQGEIYLHADGSPRVEVALSSPLAATINHLYLVSSDAEITFSSLSGGDAAFEMSGLVPCKVGFAGLPPKASCTGLINNRPFSLASTEAGHLILDLPANSRVVLRTPRSQHAALH